MRCQEAFGQWALFGELFGESESIAFGYIWDVHYGIYGCYEDMMGLNRHGMVWHGKGKGRTAL